MGHFQPEMEGSIENDVTIYIIRRQLQHVSVKSLEMAIQHKEYGAKFYALYFKT